MQAFQWVSYECTNSIAAVGLQRPDKCNAINGDLARELSLALERANDEARVGVIFGHGKHFCSGLDLSWMSSQISSKAGKSEGLGFSPKSHGPMHLIGRGRIPYIAAVQGAVIGLGMELTAAAHIRVGDPSAFFELPEARRGIYLGGGGSAYISRLIGTARMQDMMLTGRRYTADMAIQTNLLQYMAPQDGALSMALSIAEKIRLNPAPSNFAIVRGLPSLADMTIDDGVFWESALARTTLGMEAVQRMSSFLDKNASS